MRDKIADWLFGDGGILRVRAILTYTLLTLVAYMTFTDEIAPDQLVQLAVMAVSFYFGTRASK